MRTRVVLCLCLLFFSSFGFADIVNVVRFLPIPIVRQATHYSCGAASLLSVLQYWNKYDEPETELYGPLKTTEKNGTDYANMIAFAQKQGLSAYAEEYVTFEKIEMALRRNETVIVDYQAWPDKPVSNWKETWEEGHYSVVVAMDPDSIYLMDPSIGGGYGYIPRGEFLDRWHDYEVREGKEVRNHQLALFIRGTEPLVSFPGKNTRIK